jgi:hypothetical protein
LIDLCRVYIIREKKEEEKKEKRRRRRGIMIRME